MKRRSVAAFARALSQTMASRSEIGDESVHVGGLVRNRQNECVVRLLSTSIGVSQLPIARRTILDHPSGLLLHSHSIIQSDRNALNSWLLQLEEETVSRNRPKFALLIQTEISTIRNLLGFSN
jgi:hypothetical protein